VVRETTVRAKRQTETAYYVTSVTRARADAERLLEIGRDHWGAIENGVHWVRDVDLDEDRCTICTGHAPQNFAAFRNAALNWLRRTGARKLAATLRSFTRNSQRLLTKFGCVK
jgi:predicted transposase YbfD/YdcC